MQKFTSEKPVKIEHKRSLDLCPCRNRRVVEEMKRSGMNCPSKIYTANETLLAAASFPLYTEYQAQFN